MINISPQVRFTGKSHLTEKPEADKIGTEEGFEYWTRKAKLVAIARKDFDTKISYRRFMENELEEINKELSVFLRDDDMAKQYPMHEKDDAGWAIYQVLVDKWETLTHFIKAIQK